jgi:hypothetical protein
VFVEGAGHAMRERHAIEQHPLGRTRFAVGLLAESTRPRVELLRAALGLGDLRRILAVGFAAPSPLAHERAGHRIATEQDEHRLVGLRSGVAVECARSVLRRHRIEPPLHSSGLPARSQHAFEQSV